MAWTVMLLSDHAADIRDVLPSFPHAPYRVITQELKETQPEDLVAAHPNLLIVDATRDLDVAEGATAQLSVARQIGLPPIIVVVSHDTVGRFRFESGADDFLM